MGYIDSISGTDQVAGEPDDLPGLQREPLSVPMAIRKSAGATMIAVRAATPVAQEQTTTVASYNVLRQA